MRAKIVTVRVRIRVKAKRRLPRKLWGGVLIIGLIVAVIVLNHNGNNINPAVPLLATSDPNSLVASTIETANIATPVTCDFSGPVQLDAGHTSDITSNPPQLTPCQTLIVTSGSLLLGGGLICGNDSAQICVLLWSVTGDDLAFQPAAASLTVDSGHDWWAVGTGSPDVMAAGQTASFWDPKIGNCGTGCAYAMVYSYRDGLMTKAPYKLTPP
jgi:hypothetical protein